MKKKVLIGLLSVVGLIVIITGVTLAFFGYIKEGSTGNTIKLGQIVFHYEETNGKGRGINLTDALPVDSDDDAKKTNNYFDFRITANSTIAQIPYTITTRLSEDSNLDPSIVKIYLTKVVGNDETELIYTTLDQLEEKEFNNKIDKVLYRTMVPVTGQSYEANYRLRIWIAEGTDFSGGIYNNKKLSLTVNVYTNDGDPLNDEHIVKADDTNIKMITVNNRFLLSESNEENIDYEVVVPYEVDNVNINPITRNIAAKAVAKKINTQTVSDNYDIEVGDNLFTLTVESADKSNTTDYSLNIERELSRDNNLTYLAVDGYSFTESFDKDITTYTTVGLEEDTITISGNKSQEDASIEGLGEKTLTNWGENRFEVVVTPAHPDEPSKTYTIIVNRVRPEAPDLITQDGGATILDKTVVINEPGTAISGIAGYEYYTTTTDTVPDDNTDGIALSSPYSLQIDYDGITNVYYRTVSNNGHKSRWSTVEVVDIDKTLNVEMNGTGITFTNGVENVRYGKTSTATITVDEGYFLTSIDCTEGYHGTATLGPTATGEQTITLYNDNYVYNGVCTFGVTSAPTARSITYNGSNQVLINEGTSTTGTMEYRLENGTFSTTLPAGNTAGNYTVYYRIVGDKEFQDTEEHSIIVNLGKANGKVTLSATSGTINAQSSTTFTVTGNTSGGTLSVASANTALATATLSGSTVRVNTQARTGSTTITVTAAATTNYKAASASYTITSNVLYLYNSGSINTGLVGDFVKKHSGDEPGANVEGDLFAKNSNHLRINHSTGVSWQTVGFLSSKKVDLTNFTKLVFVVDRSSYVVSTTSFTMGYTTNYNTAQIEYYGSFVSGAAVGSNHNTVYANAGSYTVNISSLRGGYYIGACIAGAYDYSDYGEAKITAIYLQ